MDVRVERALGLDLGEPLLRERPPQRLLDELHAFDEGGLLVPLGSLDRAKYLANKIAVDAAALALRTGGASGFLRTSPIQRHHRDAQAGQLMAYSTEVIAGVIGRSVLEVEDVA